MADIDIPLGEPPLSSNTTTIPSVYIPSSINHNGTTANSSSLPSYAYNAPTATSQQQQQQQQQYSNSNSHTNYNNNTINQQQHEQPLIRLHPSHRQYKNIPFDNDTTRELHEQGYSNGLIESLHENIYNYPLRIWIVDNSGSMKTSDGTKIVSIPNNPKQQSQEQNNTIKMIHGCSRWTEMQQTIEYHAQLSANIRAPSIFRLLNPPTMTTNSSSSTTSNQNQQQQFGIGIESYDTIPSDLSIALNIMNESIPSGVTPLTYHLNEIRKTVLQLQSQLRQDNTKIVIIIATDGLPSDERGYTTDIIKKEFEDTLRSMESLPIWFVIRLLTNEDDVVSFWNNIDTKLELSLEVIDDYESEAKEMYQCNPWLNYGIPLHRIREMGYNHYILDLLDEKKLTKSELYQFCIILYGKKNMELVPDPDINWNGFIHSITKLNNCEKKQYNTITNKLQSWINIDILKQQYRSSNNNGCGCIIS